MSACRPGWSTSHAVPLRAWRDHDLACVAGAVEASLREWARDWDVAPEAAGPVLCTAASERLERAGPWQCLGKHEDVGAWVRWGGGEAERLAAGWFAASGATQVVAAVVRACQDDALRRLAAAVQVRAVSGCGTHPPAVAWTQWNGAVLASLPWGAMLLLEAGLVPRLLGRSVGPADIGSAGRPALVPVGEAIAAMPMELHVHLQGCELDLGDLQDLQLGDVLRLRHPVDAPATVSVAGGDVLLAGWLARSRGRKAVELAPAGMH